MAILVAPILTLFTYFLAHKTDRRKGNYKNSPKINNLITLQKAGWEELIKTQLTTKARGQVIMQI